MPDISRAFAGPALAKSVEAAARDFRVASTGRAELGKLLAAKDLRKLADADPDLNAQLAAASTALSETEKAAAAWQKALAEATKRWRAGLAELARIHG